MIRGDVVITDVVALLTALGIFLPAIGAFWNSIRNSRRLKEVHTIVNGQSDDKSKRIDTLVEENRELTGKLSEARATINFLQRERDKRRSDI